MNEIDNQDRGYDNTTVIAGRTLVFDYFLRTYDLDISCRQIMSTMPTETMWHVVTTFQPTKEVRNMNALASKYMKGVIEVARERAKVKNENPPYWWCSYNDEKPYLQAQIIPLPWGVEVAGSKILEEEDEEEEDEQEEEEEGADAADDEAADDDEDEG